jgi:hypothetical protein
MGEDSSGKENSDRQTLSPHSGLNNLLRGGLMSGEREEGKVKDDENNTYLLRIMIVPATAMPAAQLPRMTLY